MVPLATPPAPPENPAPNPSRPAPPVALADTVVVPGVFVPEAVAVAAPPLPPLAPAPELAVPALPGIPEFPPAPPIVVAMLEIAAAFRVVVLLAAAFPP